MSKDFISHVEISAILISTLKNEIGDFGPSMAALGYRPSTIVWYVNAGRHFVRWLGNHAAESDILSKETVEEFLYRHLRDCRCAPPAPRDLKTVRAAVRRFLLFIPQTGFHCQAPGETSPIDRELYSYQAHLQDVCGLSEATRTYRLRYAREFLERIGIGTDGSPNRISPKEIIEHVTRKANGSKPGSIRVLADSIRSYLRWLQLRGLVGSNIVSSVPLIPQWRLTEIPRALSETQVKQFLDSFDRSIPSGQRDFAMALCMVEMGLRASEIADLTLTDIDWRQGTMKIPTSKCKRVRLLPLPHRPGAAIARYLRNGRPATTSSYLFVRFSVPRGTALSTELVRGAMRRSYARAGFPATWTGTHLLRHTAATSIYRRGATLKQIADVLGHRSIDTTTIYTKVNLPELRMVALPWPEVQT